MNTQMTAIFLEKPKVGNPVRIIRDGAQYHTSTVEEIVLLTRSVVLVITASGHVYAGVVVDEPKQVGRSMCWHG